MESNPYKPPQHAYDPVEIPTEETIAFISWHVKAIGVCIFFYLGLGYFGGMLVQAESFRLLSVLLLLIAASIAIGAVLNGRLMWRISSPAQGVGYALCTLIPLIGLFFLFFSLSAANRYLKDNGLKFELSTLSIKPLVEMPKDDTAQSATSRQPTLPSAPAIPSHNVGIENSIALNAEQLANCGIAQAYRKITPALVQLVSGATPLREQIDGYDSSYSVHAGETTYRIDGPDVRESNVEAWRRATFAIFDIVNRQLVHSDTGFYAVGQGGGLAGVFLTLPEFEEAKNLLSNDDRPYLPIDLSQN